MSMFRTASKTKTLTISTPFVSDPNTSDVQSNSNPTPRTQIPDHQVILISKFNFKAENKHELSVGVGEALKLIERKGNGWILVKPIGRLGDPGLVPTSYVKIVKLAKDRLNSTEVNDAWLAASDEAVPITTSQEDSIEPETHNTNISSSPQLSGSASPMAACSGKYTSLSSSTSSHPDSIFNSNSISADTPDSSFSFEHAASIQPTSGLVRNAACHNGRYWYRVDIMMNDGKKRYLCRYYQDFYKLHCAIVEKLRSASEYEDDSDAVRKLPVLPDPIPRPDLQTLSTILMERCQMLNVYIYKIVQNKYKLDYGEILDQWIQPRLGDIELNGKETLSSEKIEALLQPLPTKVHKKDSSPSPLRSPPLPAQQEPPSPSPLPVRQRPVLNISTSIAQPTYSPAINRTPSNVSLNTTTAIHSPIIWNSPTTSQAHSWKRSYSVGGSNATSPSARMYPSRTVTKPIFENSDEPLDFQTPNNFKVRSRNASMPTISPITPLRASSEFVKIKVFATDDDIFALKVKRDVDLESMKQSILTRLECDVRSTLVKLYYKNNATGHFIPLVNDTELGTVLAQSKVTIKLHLVSQ